MVAGDAIDPAPAGFFTYGATGLDNDRMTLQEWERVRNFLFDLTDPDMFGFAVTDEVRRRALELLELFK